MMRTNGKNISRPLPDAPPASWANAGDINIELSLRFKQHSGCQRINTANRIAGL